MLDVDDGYVGLDSRGLCDLLDGDTIIQTVAPIANFDRDPLLAFHGEKLLRSSSVPVDAPSQPLRYVAYILSTGVYGNYDGKWVTEDSNLLCTDGKSLAMIQAEEEWGKLER